MKVPGVFYNAKSFRDVPAGTVIFEEGASGAEMFGILDGEVEVRLPNGAVRRLGPDDTFGEMAIVDTSPRSATAVAVTDTKLAVIDRARFLFLVQETPMFALQVMTSMANRLRELTPTESADGPGRCVRRVDQAADSAAVCVLISVRNASTTRVCSWLTRDSVTPSTRPISARVKPS